MAEQKTEAGGVEITVGEKTTGEKAVEAIPIVGNFTKTTEALGKTGETGGVSGLTSEGSALINGLVEAGQGLAMDPLGWLVGQGLNFLISVVQPLEDAIHMVSGDGPALSQAGENFGAIAAGVADMRTKFTEDLQNSVQSWGGNAAEAAGTKLGEFAHGIDGVAAQAGELAELLMMSSMVMQVIEDVIKAILTEFITWLIMIWIPALAAAVPSCGASTAAAGAATGVRAATTVSRVSRIVAKLRQLLTKIMDFLRKLAGRAKNLGTGFKKAMADRKAGVATADGRLKPVLDKHGKWSREWLTASPRDKLNSSEGMVGERMNQGFWKSMGDAAGTEAAAQLNYQHEKGARNAAAQEKAAEYDQAGTDFSKQRIEGYLDI